MIIRISISYIDTILSIILIIISTTSNIMNKISRLLSIVCIIGKHHEHMRLSILGRCS